MNYAGIGSRSTPVHILGVMKNLAAKLEGMGYILRSGGAAGADSAFEAGVKIPTNKEIYLPGKSFNSKYSGQPGIIDASALPHWQQAIATVNQFHPAPGALSSFARNLMARNAMQVLGKTLDQPAKMIVAWTPGGQISGGTGQALRMAQAYQIPVRNLGNPEVLESVHRFLSSNS